MESPSERLKTLAGLVRAMYNEIAQALLDLPISIQIPRLDREGSGRSTALAALDRAFALLVDEPIGDTERCVLEDAIREWRVAHDALWVLRQGEFSELAAGNAETALELVEFNLHQLHHLREGGEDGGADPQ